MKLVYDVSHNIAKVERHKVDGEGTRDLVVHRKGATRAFPSGMEQLPSKIPFYRSTCNHSRINGYCKLDTIRK